MVHGHLLSSGFPHMAANMETPGVISGSPSISGLWARAGDVGVGVGCITRVPCPVPTPDLAVGVMPEALQEAGSSFLFEAHDEIRGRAFPKPREVLSRQMP